MTVQYSREEYSEEERKFHSNDVVENLKMLKIMMIDKIWLYDHNRQW